MRVLVMGATGALGMNVVRQALAAGHSARAMVRNPARWPAQLPAEMVAGDPGNPAEARQAAEGCGAVLYCINPPLDRWSELAPLLLDHALAACRAAGARFVFPGNVWVFGKGEPGKKVAESAPRRPCSQHGALRVAMERTIAGAGVPYTIVRLPEFYGPNVTNKLMGAVFANALAGKPVRWCGPLDARVEYVYMPDGVAAMVRAGLDERSDGETFHVPGAAPTTPREFLGEVIRQAGTRSRIRTVPPLAVRVVGLAQPLVGAFADILHLWTHPVLLDGGKYEQWFGPLPRTPYPEGIAHTLAWFRERSSPGESLPTT